MEYDAAKLAHPWSRALSYSVQQQQPRQRRLHFLPSVVCAYQPASSVTVKTTEGLTFADDALALRSTHVLSGRHADVHLHALHSWTELVLKPHDKVHAKDATLVC